MRRIIKVQPSSVSIDVYKRQGYQRYQQDVMIATIILLVIIVQLIQFAFGLLASAIDKRNH